VFECMASYRVRNGSNARVRHNRAACASHRGAARNRRGAREGEVAEVRHGRVKGHPGVGMRYRKGWLGTRRPVNRSCRVSSRSSQVRRNGVYRQPAHSRQRAARRMEGGAGRQVCMGECPRHLSQHACAPSRKPCPAGAASAYGRSRAAASATGSWLRRRPKEALRPCASRPSVLVAALYMAHQHRYMWRCAQEGMAFSVDRVEVGTGRRRRPMLFRHSLSTLTEAGHSLLHCQLRSCVQNACPACSSIVFERHHLSRYGNQPQQHGVAVQ